MAMTGTATGALPPDFTRGAAAPLRRTGADATGIATGGASCGASCPAFAATAFEISASGSETIAGAAGSGTGCATTACTGTGGAGTTALKAGCKVATGCAGARKTGELLALAVTTTGFCAGALKPATILMKAGTFTATALGVAGARGRAWANPGVCGITGAAPPANSWTSASNADTAPACAGIAAGGVGIAGRDATAVGAITSL